MSKKIYHIIIIKMTEIDNVTLITMMTICVGAFGLMIRGCFISKCVSFSICYGCIDVQRDPKLENEECKINTHILDNPSNSNNV